MYRLPNTCLQRLLERQQPGALARGLKGLEKESLRVDHQGHIATTPHPTGLGAALTHPSITTDFSEALLEFVTPAFEDVGKALNCLEEIHTVVYQSLQDELLWTASMPCAVQDDASVPLARYGSSNVGRMKTIYRRGLGYRYGRVMQTISGIHFNYSLPLDFWPALRECVGSNQPLEEFISASYFALLRNFRRYGWIVLYLFGASPAICKSFLRGAGDGLDELDSATFYLPHATSLRMSDIGYSNKVQSSLHISVNSLDEYVAGLERAIQTPHPQYEAIGVKVDGKYRQLSSNVLQIENEFYSAMRPKRRIDTGERPTAALRRRGVEYVEMRALDVNPFAPAGMELSQLRFLEAFLLSCVLRESPAISEREQVDLDENQLAVARRGRQPGLKLKRQGETITLRGWASEIMKDCLSAAKLLDTGRATPDYADTVTTWREAVDDASRTLSARVLREMESRGESYFQFALRMSEQHRSHYQSVQPLPEPVQRRFAELAATSIQKQHDIETSDEISFDDYLKAYYR